MTIPFGANRIAELERFFADCVGSLGSEQAARLAEAAALFGSSDSASEMDEVPTRRASIRDAIAAGAAVDAALAIIGDETVFMLSRGAGGTCLATMILADCTEEVMGEAATPALALLAAYAAALLDVAERDPADPPSPEAPLSTRFH